MLVYLMEMPSLVKLFCLYICYVFILCSMI